MDPIRKGFTPGDDTLCEENNDLLSHKFSYHSRKKNGVGSTDNTNFGQVTANERHGVSGDLELRNGIYKDLWL